MIFQLYGRVCNLFLKGSSGPIFLWYWLLCHVFLVTGVVAAVWLPKHFFLVLLGLHPPCVSLRLQDSFLMVGVQWFVNLKHLEVVSSLV